MQPSLASKVVNRHGLISDALSAMPLEVQVAVASLINRSYDVTVPWNVPSVPFPVYAQNKFPKIDDISDDFIFKRTENAAIEGENGSFIGPVSKVSGLSQGCGVFVTDQWIHCSTVANGIFTAGKRVSVNKQTKEMRLVNTKFQSDGSKLQKIESFTPAGVTSGLYQDGVRVGDITERLNLTHDNQDWLSLRPSDAKYYYEGIFGEFNEKNKLHGRGIRIDSYGDIFIGYFNKGWRAPGNFILIYKDGDVDVCEHYLKGGENRARGTRYMANGTIYKFDH
jgi:hypothetical protein